MYMYTRQFKTRVKSLPKISQYDPSGASIEGM